MKIRPSEVNLNYESNPNPKRRRQGRQHPRASRCSSAFTVATPCGVVSRGGIARRAGWRSAASAHPAAAKTRRSRFLKAKTNGPSAIKKLIAKKGATIFAPRGIAHTYRNLGQTPGRLMCVITPSGFEGFFEEIGALSPQQQQEIPRVLEIAKKFGLEFLPPRGV